MKVTDMNNMTALVSCFARAYHYRMNQVRIFSDDAAYPLLNENYDQIAAHMMQGKDWFLPGFTGSAEEALRLIVDRQLSPSVLGRSAFCEQMLEEAGRKGCRQYLILAAGYDTYGIRNRNSSLNVFEADLPELLSDKKDRIRKAGLDSCSVYVPVDLSKPSWVNVLRENSDFVSERTFVSMLGISYYLPEEAFSMLLNTLGHLLPENSELCFDCPAEEEGHEAGRSRKLAHAAGEEMKAHYSLSQLKYILNQNGFRIQKLLDHNKMTEQFFKTYNTSAKEHPIEAPQGVCYVLAEKEKVQDLEK